MRGIINRKKRIENWLQQIHCNVLLQYFNGWVGVGVGSERNRK